MTSDLVPKSLAEKMARWKEEAKIWHPHAYQERALKFMLSQPQSGLLLDPGLGKTSISLAAAKILIAKRMLKRALVIAPLRAIYDVWPAEVSDWKDFNELGIALLHGSAKDRVLRSLRTEHQIALINPEGFSWLTDKRERLKLLDSETLIVDESSRWKDPLTVRFKALRPLVERGVFRRRHILTGSPRPRNYLDLFGQIFIMDRGAALGSFISHYRNQFFFPTGYMMREWALLPGMDKEINKLVAPLVLRLDAKDYLKLPKTPERTHRITLPAKAQAEYDRIEESMMSVLFTEPLTSSASARSKCCQIANGCVYTDGPADERWPTKTRPVKVLHTAKVDAVVDLYGELQGEPLFLAIGYHHDVDALRSTLGKDVPCINGNTTRTQAADFIERWNKGLIPLLLAHPASAGHALNLQKFNARHVGFFDIPDSFDLYDQFFRRVWRQGNQADFVMCHYFVAESTMDVAKMRNLKRKGTEQKDFLDAMREYAEAKYRRKMGRRG